MESSAEQVTHIWDKTLLYIGILFGSISLLDVKEILQFYSLIVAAISVTLSCILYVVRIRKEYPSIKEHVEKEVNKKCP